MTTRAVWEEEPTVVGRLGKPVVLTLIALAIAFPLYVVVVTSLSSTEAVTRAGGLVVVPRELTVAAYVQLLSGGVVTRAMLISIGITVVRRSASGSRSSRRTVCRGRARCSTGRCCSSYC